MQIQFMSDGMIIIFCFAAAAAAAAAAVINLFDTDYFTTQLTHL